VSDALPLAEILDRLRPEFLAAAAMRVADSAIVFGSSEYEMALRAAAKAKGVDVPAGEVAAPALALTRAAVLVGFVDRPEGPTVLLTQRTAHLADHGGQISFPGGRMEEADADIVAAALRETEEEVGLTPSSIAVAGALEDHGTVSGYRVTPVVGVIAPPLALTLDPFEVAEAFEVPFAFIRDPANRQTERVTRGSAVREIYTYPYAGRRIWGFTARILARVADIVNAAGR
jgi:8-oxo-dGTP pyrophosphatase MutT (NUDIX family)